MKTSTFAPFQIIGISVRTSNENGKAATDIGQLWHTFMTEEIKAKIPNKIDDKVFAIYTNYESDHTQAYDTILGCKVSTLDEIPEEMVGQSFAGGRFAQFVAEGDLSKAVYQKWVEIWNTDLNRTYTADFELYDAKSQNIAAPTVAIFVAIQDELEKL